MYVIIHPKKKYNIKSACGKLFMRLSTLKIHAIIHTEEKHHEEMQTRQKTTACHPCGESSKNISECILT